jgi:putative membrane protein
MLAARPVAVDEVTAEEISVKLLTYSAAAALICLSFPATSWAQPAAPASSSSPASVTGPDYMKMAAASDLYEIQSSQAVLQTTKSPDVRRFAQMMIDHHTKTTTDLMAAAKGAGLNAPAPALDTQQKGMLTSLQAASGAGRDQLYVQQQVAAHEQALALHSAYAQNGDMPALKAAAAKTAPVVKQHLSEIQRIAGAGK